MASLVQSTAGVSSNAATLNITLPQPTGQAWLPYGANCLIAVVFVWGDAGTAPALGSSSVTLGAATMTLQGSVMVAGATGAGAAAFYAIPSVPSGQSTVTVTVTGKTSGNSISAACYEFAGMATASLLDKEPALTAAATTSWSSNSTGTTSQAYEVVIGAYGGWDNATWTPVGPGSPWVNTATQTSAASGGVWSKFFAGYRALTTQQSLTYAGTGGNTSYWNEAAVATFRAATPVNLAVRRPPPPSADPRQRARGIAGGIAPPPSAALAGPTAIVGVSAPAGTVSGAVTVLQQVSGTSQYDYGLTTLNLATTAGSALILLAGWDLSVDPTDAAMPALWVNDSAGNVWHHAGTTSSSVTGSRCAAWVCTAARAVTWISASLTTFASSLAVTVLEMANMPADFSLDVAGANATAGDTALSVAPGVAGGADVAFAVLSSGADGVTVLTPAQWTALETVTSGAGEPNPVQIFPYWMPASPGQSLDVSWTADRAAPLAAAVFAIRANAPGPVQANPNLPALVIEAAFGAIPGDPSQSPPEWTDITNRVMAKMGDAFLSSTMGRQYELATPESGELHLSCLNWDGAFTPGNENSPYYPDVVLGTPVRARAWWAGQWYHLGYGWTERWPQDWPDMPQFGLSKMIATDAISVMASATMVSALDADMLLDEPYVLLQASEQYFTYSNGLNAAGVLDSYSIAPAQGLLAANVSRVNQRAGTYVDGSAAQAATGQATYMLGDSDTGFGTSSISTAPTVSASGPGIIYTDPDLPSPQSPSGVSVQFWVVIGTTVTSPALQPTVFTAYGPPSSYGTRPSLTAKVLNYTGSAALQVTLASGATVSAPFNVSSSPQQIVLAITASSLSIYVNGALGATASLQAADTTTWRAVSLGCPNFAWGTSAIGVGNFVAFDLAVYGFQIPYQRVVSNYSTGAEGQKGVDATTRLAQILAWANLGIARAGQVTFAGAPASVTQGPAYQLGGQTASDAANQLATNEAGMVIATPSGAVQFMHREALFNLPSQVTFGDSIVVADAQIPFLQSTGFDFDNTYLYNRVTITMQVGPNTTITVTTNDFASQFAYFLRSALQQTVQTTNNLDAYALAQWYLAKYSQPQIRVRTIVIDAASHPAAFPAVLGIQQGQVATVTRNPVGGAPITETCLVERIEHQAGPSMFRTSLQLAPWTPEDGVLQLDVPPNNTLGGNTLA